MARKVDLYSSSYSNYEWEVYRELRIETYGKDLGQTSWVTTDESNEIPGCCNYRADPPHAGNRLRFRPLRSGDRTAG
jgi:hypothetical protein